LHFIKEEEMKFKTGDKVKFLNTTGGGVISKIVDKHIVHVAIEDGFEVPVMVNDLILTGRVSDAAANLFRSEGEASTPRTPAPEVSVRQQNQHRMVPGTYAGQQVEQGVYLCFRPMDQRMLTIGDLEVILINHTPHPLSAQLYRKQGEGYRLFRSFSIDQKQSLILEQIERKGLDEWLQGALQFMVQPKETGALILPVHTAFHLKGSRFFKAESYEQTNLDPQQLIAVLLKGVQSLQPAGVRKPESQISARPEEKNSTPKPEPLIKRHLKEDGSAEVDLHIHHLVEKTQGLNPREAFQIQSAYFQKVLNSAIAERVNKLIIIHGVGNGILKAEIIKAVEELSFATTYDAPILKYGIGATVIELYLTKVKS
jgi:hypothetical protein